MLWVTQQGSPAAQASARANPGDNLPIELTSFIGREDVCSDIHLLLADHRLVTLTGVGGVGKTRLALQTAAQLTGSYADGVWFVDLAHNVQPDLVSHMIATTVGVYEEPGRPVVNTLTDALRGRELLIVLDNCEHVVEACARTTQRLMQACARVRILATSREPLGVPGEMTRRVQPLNAVDPSRSQQLALVMECEAVRLFEDRARLVQPGFTVTQDNGPAVAQICHRLDGIPLAIELAAARVGFLTPQDIVARLDGRFNLLTGGSRTRLERQRTLRALIDWSHDLLSREESALFRRVSIFNGGWTLEAAEAVCAAEPLEASNILADLAALVNKSLVVAEEQPSGHMRYRLLETLRAYAAEKLANSGEYLTTARRHAGYYVDRIEAVDQVRITDWPAWRDRGWPWIHAEIPNVRSILDRSRAGEVDAGGIEEWALRICASTWWFWCMHDQWFEAWHAVTTQLNSLPYRMTPVRFWVTWFAGITAGVLGTFEESGRLLAEARATAIQLGDDQLLAAAEGALGQDLLHQGRLVEAQELTDQALDRARQVGPQHYLPIFLYNAGWTALRQGRLDDARNHLDQSIAIGRAIGDEFALGIALPLRATVSILGNDSSVGAELLTEAKQLSDAVPNRGLGIAIVGLGRLSLLNGDAAGAARQFTSALDYAVRIGRRILVCEGLEGLAFVSEASGDAETAVRLLAATGSLRTTMYAGGAPDYRGRIEAQVTRLRQRLGDSDFQRAWLQGLELSVDEATSLAQTVATVVLGTDSSASAGDGNQPRP